MPDSIHIDFHTVILGGGPAGTGPLVQAIRTGEFDALLAKGVAVVDRGTTLRGYREFRVQGSGVLEPFSPARRG